MTNESDPTEESRDGPTSNGGVRSTVYYQDANGQPAPKSKAVRAEGVEFDAAGRQIRRTYFEITPVQ